MMKSLIMAAILSLLLIEHTFPGTTLEKNDTTFIYGGDVNGTWTLDKSPYFIEGDITIPSDSTLTIEPGVTVNFQGHFALNVQGRLLAIGTENDSILFTVNDTTGFSDPDTNLGGWYGIRFIDTPQHNDSSMIEYCRLQYGKAVGPVWHLNAGGAVCIVQFHKVRISHCLITRNLAGSPTEHSPIGGGLYLFKSDAIITNNTFTHNRAHSGGAVYFDDSNPAFRNNIIKNNFAVYGAGVGMGGTSLPIFSGDKFIHNTADSHGGGLRFFQPSEVTCNGVTFSYNKAQWGGGIGVQGGTLKAENCLISDNRATLWGGGIAGDFATLQLTNCTFIRDTSDWGSGGMHLDHANAQITDCRFEENIAIFGGGMHGFFSKVSAQNSAFINNTSETGAGAHFENGDLDLTACLFESNHATNGSGGGIDCRVDSTIFGRPYWVTLNRTEFTGNSASTNSAALRIEQSASEFSLADVMVDSCTFSKNHSDVYGSMRIGGNFDEFIVANCTFKNNTSNRYVAGAGLIGGAQGQVYNSVFFSNYAQYSDSTKSVHGVSIGSGAEVEFFNCTFVDTSQADGNGISLRRGSTAHVLNTIIWKCGNRPISVVTAAGLGCTVYINYCDIENGSDSIYVSDSLSTLNFGTNNMFSDPWFVNPSAGDVRLTDESTCIGAGVNSFIMNDRWFTAPTRDIEGNPRPNPQGSNADLGAFENEYAIGVGISQQEANPPHTFQLYQNYPNPFNPRTVIRYSLSVNCEVDLTIYNLLGQRVAKLVSKQQPAGYYELQWDATGFASGIYLYKLKTSKGFTEIKKLVLLK